LYGIQRQVFTQTRVYSKQLLWSINLKPRRRNFKLNFRSSSIYRFVFLKKKRKTKKLLFITQFIMKDKVPEANTKLKSRRLKSDSCHTIAEFSLAHKRYINPIRLSYVYSYVHKVIYTRCLTPFRWLEPRHPEPSSTIRPHSKCV